VHPISTTEGYCSWAEFYDEPGNQLVDLEQPIVREILDGLPRGVALDAASGTGRHSAYLASLGHSVIGVDSRTRRQPWLHADPDPAHQRLPCGGSAPRPSGAQVRRTPAAVPPGRRRRPAIRDR
jgi:hypothetical protein